MALSNRYNTKIYSDHTVIFIKTTKPSCIIEKNLYLLICEIILSTVML